MVLAVPAPSTSSPNSTCDSEQPRPGDSPGGRTGATQGSKRQGRALRDTTQEAAMRPTALSNAGATSNAAGPGRVDTKLEVVVTPMSDVDVAAEFYGWPGRTVDADLRDRHSRVLQITRGLPALRHLRDGRRWLSAGNGSSPPPPALRRRGGAAKSSSLGTPTERWTVRVLVHVPPRHDGNGRGSMIRSW